LRRDICDIPNGTHFLRLFSLRLASVLSLSHKLSEIGNSFFERSANLLPTLGDHHYVLKSSFVFSNFFALTGNLSDHELKLKSRLL
jgi:hypothetical protein